MNIDVILCGFFLALVLGVWRFYRVMQAEWFRQKNILHTRFVASYVRLTPRVIPVASPKPSPHH